MIAVGLRVGSWTVLSPTRVTSKTRDYAGWTCLCDCGTRRRIQHANLAGGRTTSCGCRSRAKHGYAPKHGKRDGTWVSWRNMHRRCRNPRDKDYKNYGERGISVCDRWSGAHGFENFLADMGKRPPGLTIERNNNDGNYEPGNCRWATRSDQRRNQRRNYRSKS